MLPITLALIKKLDESEVGCADCPRLLYQLTFLPTKVERTAMKINSFHAMAFLEL